MEVTKITAKKMREELVPELMKAQHFRCPMCNLDLRKVVRSNVVVDHCHDTGRIRGVLCRNCNGQSGRMENLAIRSKKELTKLQWLQNAVAYLSKKHDIPYIYPTHKTAAEKLAKRNLQARIRRAERKANAS